MRAPCGIDCAECDIFRAAHNPAEAEKLAERWRTSGQPRAEAGWFVCQGCRGDRSLCWSEDCSIYACVTEKAVDFCYECRQFPCETLEAWSSASPNHTTALEWLKAQQKN